MEVKDDNLQQYYTYLKGAKADVPNTFESFQKTLSDDKSAKQYYDYLKANKFDAPDTFDSFSNTLGLKKKDASDYSYPTSKAFSETSSKPEESKPEDKKPDEPKVDVEKKIKDLLATSKQPQNPFLQSVDATSVNNQTTRPLPQTNTLGDYLKNKNVTASQLELPEDVNPNRELRDGEQAKFDSLLKLKGLDKPPETSYFWGAGKDMHKVVSSVFKDLDNASKTLSDITGLKRGGIFGDLADFVDKRSEGIMDMPKDEIGRLLDGAIGLEPMFIEMAATPEFKIGTAFGKSITASRFFLQQMGTGFFNSYAGQLDKGTPDKALTEGLKGGGEGALTAIVFSKLGYGSSKLGEAVTKATGSGVAGGATNMIANATGFTGYTLAEMIARGQPINDDELRSAAELGALMTVPDFARFAMGRATGNYLMSSPKAEKTANDMTETVSELRDKALDIREKAKDESNVQKKAAQESAANAIDGFADIKVMSKEVANNPAVLTNAIEQADLTPDQQKLLKDKIDASETASVSTPEITSLNNDIESLKKGVAKWEGKQDVPEAVRKAKIDALNGQIADKEKQIKSAITPKEEATGEKSTEPVKETSAFPEGYKPEVKIRKSGTDKVRALNKDGKEASSITFHTEEIDGKKYWKVAQTASAEEGKGLAQNVYKYAMENLPEGYAGIMSPKETRHNQAQIPHILEKLGKIYDSNTDEAGNIFLTPKEAPDGMHKVEAEWDKNKWMTELQRFRDMTPAAQKKDPQLKNNLLVNAKKLGIDVNLDDNTSKPVNAETKEPVRKTPSKPSKEKIEAQKLLTEYPPEFQKHVGDVLETNPDLYGVMIGGLSNDQRLQAFNDIKANKKSAASLSTLKELERMWKEHGGIDVWESVSKQKITVSPQEIADAKAELLAEKDRKELDKYSYEDIDKALEKGLITKDEYDGIKDYITESARASEEAGAAEENFLADNNGNNASSTEKSQAKPEEVKPKYWNKEDAPKGMKEQFASVKLKDGAEEALKNLPKKPIQTLDDGTKVYEVGGQYIRDNVHQEFTQGGNEGAYPSYVPKGEIWIDDVLGPKDREATILHESVEQRDMLDNGSTYKDAHEKANKVEAKFRETGEKPEIKPTDENKSEVQQPDNTKGTEGKTNLSGGTEADKGQPTPKGEEKSVTESADKGVNYNGKIYKTVDEVQDDLADKKLTFEESKPLMEKVRKFEEQEIKNRLANHLEDLADSIGAIKKFEGAERETVIKNLMNVLKDLADLTKLKGEQLLAKLKEYLKEHKKEIPDDVINEAFKRHNEKTPESKLIEDLKSVPTKKVSMKERMDGIKTAFDRLSEKIPEGEDKFWAKFGNKLDNLKENTKAVWKAYVGLPEFTDYKKALGDWSFAKQTNDKALMDFTKLAEKKVPLRSRREAILNYIEANGDIDALKKREEGSKKNYKQGYKDAQNLTPDEIKIANSIKEYFDSMLKNGFDAGILKSMVENYVTHIGVRPDDPKVAKAIGGFDNGKLNTTFKYAKGRVFDTFFDLEQAGFRGEKDFKNIIPAYSSSFNRTIYSRAFIKNLTEGKAKDGRPIVVNAGIGSMTGDENIAKAALVNPYSKPEEASDYKYINHPAFRDWYWATKTADGTNVFAKGELVIHPDYHLSLSNILGKSDLMKSIPLREVTKAVNVTKQTIFMLSPFFHYIQEGYHAIGHTVNPLFGLTKFDPHDMNHQKLIQGGLKLYDFQAKSNFAEGLASLNIASKIPIIKDTILPIQEYLFNEYIPRLKLTTAEHMLSRNLKRYQGKYSQDQIYALTASHANAAYGNLNYELIGRNPTVQHIFRMAALAPDFLEARTRFVGQALTPKGAEQRRALLILGGTMFVASRIMNKLFDDDYHWEKPFSFIYNKNEYTLRSVPEDAWELINDPNRFIYNRMSPLFRSVVVEGLTKRDFRGIPESTEDWLKSIVTSPMPSQVTRMLPEGWGKNESDDKLWDDFINTIGLRERHYFTPVEKEIRNTYYERDPRGKLSENQKYKMKVRQAINKIATQNGNEPLTEENVKKMSDLINENVKNGKLTIYQGQDLLDNIGGEKKDVLVTMYNRLPEDDKETIYNKMSDKEKEVYPIPKGLYSPYNLLKGKNEDVYDRLIEYGGVKTIHQDVKMSIFNKNVKLDKKASEEFNDDLIQKYGEQVKALIGTDKKRFDELKKTEMPVTKDNPEGNMLKEYLNMAWERAHLQAEQTAKIKFINKK